MYTSLVCFKYQPDDYSWGVETCSWLSYYFIKLRFDGCQFAFYLYLQHNGMNKIKDYSAL